ncbi:MAG TPA: hypothetical protein VH500_22300 [Nitrososphaeraceae archaeon]
MEIDETPLDRFESRNTVAVATIYGRSYFNIVNALKVMDLAYESLSPEQVDSSDTRLVITTKDESGIIHTKNVLLDTELNQTPILSKAKILRAIMGHSLDDSLVIGVDPGYRIGISIIYFHNEIESFVQHSPESAIEIISVILTGIISQKKLVKIGDGNITMCNHIATSLKTKFKDSIDIEIVDEYGTSMRHNVYSNRRGLRDCSSAKMIAFRRGRSL